MNFRSERVGGGGGGGGADGCGRTAGSVSLLYLDGRSLCADNYWMNFDNY